MKRVLVVIIGLFMVLSPIGVFATSYQEYPPYITVANEEKYDVEKIINDEEVIVRLKEKCEKTYYSWSFDKSEVGNYINLDFEIDFESDKKSEIDEVAGGVNKTYLSFKHHGDLPSKAKITVYVGDKYKNNQKLFLYYYNEDTKKVEAITNNLKVVDGYVEFEISHCSEYFLTTRTVKIGSFVSSPISLKYIITIMAFVVIFLASNSILQIKKGN